MSTYKRACYVKKPNEPLTPVKTDLSPVSTSSVRKRITKENMDHDQGITPKKRKCSNRTKRGGCYVLGCDTKRRNHAPNVSFHKFPERKKRPDLRKKWDAASGRGVILSDYAFMCSKHFDERMIYRTHDNVAKLHHNAVPTLHLAEAGKIIDRNYHGLYKLNASEQDMSYEYIQTASDDDIIIVRGENDEAERNKATVESIEAQILRVRLANNERLYAQMQSRKDHSYSLASTSPRQMKRDIHMLIDKVTEFKVPAKNLKSRLQRKTRTLEKVTKELARLKKENAAMSEQLVAYKDIPVNLLAKSENKKYTIEQKEFACTILSYSPKTYRFLRKNKFNLPTPHTVYKYQEALEKQEKEQILLKEQKSMSFLSSEHEEPQEQLDTTQHQDSDCQEQQEEASDVDEQQEESFDSDDEQYEILEENGEKSEKVCLDDERNDLTAGINDEQDYLQLSELVQEEQVVYDADTMVETGHGHDERTTVYLDQQSAYLASANQQGTAHSVPKEEQSALHALSVNQANLEAAEYILSGPMSDPVVSVKQKSTQKFHVRNPKKKKVKRRNLPLQNPTQAKVNDKSSSEDLEQQVDDLSELPGATSFIDDFTWSFNDEALF